MDELVRKANEIGDAELMETSGGYYDGPCFTYTVVSGDTLSGIAYRFNCDMWFLAYINNISNPNVIRVGQTLIIPYYYY